MSEIYALTIQQPWPWAICHAGKRVENRSWPTQYRGKLFIHAGLSHASMSDHEIKRICASTFTLIPKAEAFVFGAIVAVCDLTDCVNYRDPDMTPQRREWLDEHPFAVGPWCWILKNVAILKTPVGCRGLQKLWVPDPSLVELVLAETIDKPSSNI